MSDRLQLKNIGKRYANGVVANDGIDLDVAGGEIHALLGENGAGKSTLVKIIYGVLAPDTGEILWEGRPVQIASPHAARLLGIGMVFQHFTLFDALSVQENIALGIEWSASFAALDKQIREVSERYGLPLDPRREVHTLSVGERQRIEIVRCLLQNPRLLIMDEPTSVLTPQEADRLFETLRRLASEGCAILYISHKLDEIRRLCDRATILRQGRVVATCDPRTETAKSLGEMMVGARIDTPTRAAGTSPGKARLQVSGLTLPPDQPFGIPLSGIGFTVHAGEIFGIAGVAGNGQAELLAALSGERKTHDPATIRLDGAPIGHRSPDERRVAGLCYIPEERNGHGAVGDLSLTENAILSAWRRKALVGAAGLLRTGKATDFAKAVVDRFAVRTAGVEHLGSSLSGGNLQKFIVGREIMQDPLVLIAAQPTWGVDAGAAALIHKALLDLAASGAAVLVVSQDLDEILALSDRLAVINVGRLSEPVRTVNASIGEIGQRMGGLHDLPAETAHA
ncbi:MAG: ABC transporter ATP-binding protein [Geminicoccaceae bacterium]